MFGTVKEGLFARHLTFVPLRGITIGPDNLQVPVSRDLVRAMPLGEGLMPGHSLCFLVPIVAPPGLRLFYAVVTLGAA